MNDAVGTGSESVEPPAPTMTGVAAELNESLGGCKTLAAARGISRAALESVYGVARELFAHGHQVQALHSLQLLCLYDHENARYWQALGTCRQALSDHLGAATALAFAIGQSEDFDGSACIQLIECLVAAGQSEAAEARLRQLIEAADETLAGEPWRARARLLQARLQNGNASQWTGPRGAESRSDRKAE